MGTIVLVGLMGTGKSTVGRLLAARLGLPLVDSDSVIAERTGATVRELWEQGGEAAYRRLESQIVLDALATPEPAVVAAPGGVVLDPAVRQALGRAFVVWLRAEPQLVAARVGHGDHRPLLGADPATVLSQMAGERASLYASVADLIVDVDDLSPEQVADAVIEQYESRTHWTNRTGPHMLKPQDNTKRETRRLDGLWEFRTDPGELGRAERWWSAPLTESQPMPVPASYNDIPVDREVHDHVGEVWYQSSVTIPRGWFGQRIVLRFDAACHRATVWLDDTEVVSHEGGYTPFEADLTDLVGPGTEHRITVAVDNRLSWQTIPPGVVFPKSNGKLLQTYYHDFYNYAGLHRSVWLYATPRAHISDVTVVTDRDGTTGVVRCQVDHSGNDGTTARVRLVDTDGTVVAEASGESTELRVPDARLWKPGAAYLYDLRVELVDGSSEVVDEYRVAVGIRTVRIDGYRFLINDEPFYFRGFGMHEDHNVRGKGHDNAEMVHDFALLDWIGANSFRTSHYPYAEEILDYADRHGIVVIDETAAVGLNLKIGGGLFRSANQSTFSDETIDSRTQEVHAQAIRELIARDKNHPSVVLWSIANEPESDTQESHDYFAPLFSLARELDPTRPVGFVNVLLAPPETCLVTELADVVMINRYYGWYLGFDLDEAEKGLEDELHRWVAKHRKPILVTEYGADTVAGLRSAVSNPWTEEYQADLLDMYHRVFDRVDEVVGEHVWNFADFATSDSIIRVEGNKKGVFTRGRKPKLSAHRLRDRWRSAK